MASANSTPEPRQRTFLGHPVGLYVLFFTEMWERFSYYGMRALLMLYMLFYLRYSQQEASGIYKIYTTLVYVTPIIGGFLADRWLGNRLAVIIGATAMAIGHFLMGFEEFPIFLSALIFLMIGNGMFKPNMSTQVGRLYPANDGRRDGAYTIFYMGINLGAFLSPIVCGWLAENTVGGYHSGFTMAGIGMFLGLMIYLLGQPFVKEIPVDAVAAESSNNNNGSSTALTEAEAERTPSSLGSFANLLPSLLFVLAGLAFIACPIMLFTKRLPTFDAIMLAIAGVCLALVGYVAGRVHGAVRDRVLVILALGIFVMFFWGAFEQAGNVLNVWADQHTNRYLTEPMQPPSVIPEVVEDKATTDVKTHEDRPGFLSRFLDLFRNMVTLKETESSGGITLNPVPTTWFQAINALAIFVLAPIFAWLWIYLDRRGYQPSIPMKMTLGLILMSASMAIMMQAANVENQVTTVALQGDTLPQGIVVTAESKLAYQKEKGGVEEFHAGRLTFDKANKKLIIYGVLPENTRDDLIEKTVPEEYRKQVLRLQEESEKIDATVKSAEVSIKVPPGFDMKYAGIKKSILIFRPEESKLVAYKPLAEKEVKGLLVAAGQPEFRATIHDLYVKSAEFRISSWWLFWSYILATLGELCLSPVGLSMVSKLAPAKFATMLMGVWLLTSAFGSFAAGLLGEIWGTIAPIQFFLFSTVVVGGAAVILFVLVKILVRMMHGVK
ncbi:MAG: peptide MFS transporter [Gemmataceae bacterium]|nr:peptide MFS transporter [Gemmataceae bacterium]MCI0739284.1 peptide MFS transporter [Gemmataceae bacterium]